MKKAWKKSLTVLLLAAFCLTLLPMQTILAQAEQTPLEKCAVVERILYGVEQEGSLVERTSKLEKELFGLPGKEALMAKVERIYQYVRENSSSAPSLVFKIGALEWSLTQKLAKGPLTNRLDALERTVAGMKGSGPVDARVSRLMAITFSGAKMKANQVSLPKDTLIKIKTVTPLDTKQSKTGDPVEFEVADDVYAAGMLVIPRGSVGRGKLTQVESAQNFGRDAKLVVNFESVEAMDLTKVATVLGEQAKKETQSLARAAGAGFAGMLLLGPIGVVGAAFVHGKNITIPPDTMLYIQTQSDIELVGMLAK